MKIDGNNSQELGALTGSASGSAEAAIRKQIQILTKQLGQLERKQWPTSDDEMKKKALKKEIAELKEQLQKAKAEDRQQRQEKIDGSEKTDEAQKANEAQKSGERDESKPGELPKSDETGETLVERLKELGLGRAIDELI